MGDSGNISDLIYHSVSTILFIAAVTILLYNINMQKNMSDYEKRELYQNRVVYMTNDDELPEDDVISYTGLCGVLYDDLDYDVRIISGADVLEISASDFSYHTFDFDKIPRAEEYLCTYKYNDNGDIEEVVYTSKT